MAELAVPDPRPLLELFARYRGTVDELDSGHSISAEQLREQSRLLGHGLRALRAEEGGRVVFAVSNGATFVAAFMSVLERGLSPLFVHADTPPAELERIARCWAARLVVGDVADLTALPGIVTKSVESTGSPLRWCSLRPFDGEDCPAIPGALLHPTSGTTGAPKLAVRSARCAIAEAESYAHALALDGDHRVIAAVPLSHAYGFGICVMLALQSGVSLTTMRSFHPGTVHRALQGRGPCLFPAVPPMLDVLALSGRGDSLSRSSVRVLGAGAPLSRGTRDKFRRRFGIEPLPTYGTTETGAITLAERLCTDDHSGGNCVGEVMPGVEATIRHAANGVTEGSGRLWVRSASTMHGYLSSGGVHDPRQDGWFDTGDVARRGACGQLHLYGRACEAINVLGVKVLPKEVEDVIASMRGIQECCVYAGQHRSGSSIIKAAIVADEAVTTALVRAHCVEHLSPHKRPHLIHRLEQLPKSASGKILRAKLP